MEGTLRSTNGVHRSAESRAKERADRVDPFGFERPEDFDYALHEELMSEYLVVLTRRSIKWSKMLTGQSKVQKNPKVKRYVRKGVPHQHRALVWMAASGAQNQLDKNPGLYQALLSAQSDAKLAESIRTDLNRTFPDNVQFRDSSRPRLQDALNNVLLAYGQHNPSVGYCQGMNFVAGYLLIVTRDEEKSFWLMDALIGRILPDYYSPAMLGLKTDQEVLGDLVKLKIPRVWKVMEEQNVMWSLVVSRWFICLYIDVLPVETVLRIWDCLFYEGSKVLFRVALTLIQHGQAAIEQARSLPDVCQAFKELARGAFVEDCHAFMQKIFSEPGSLSMATLRKLRARRRALLAAEES